MKGDHPYTALFHSPVLSLSKSFKRIKVGLKESGGWSDRSRAKTPLFSQANRITYKINPFFSSPHKDHHGLKLLIPSMPLVMFRKESAKIEESVHQEALVPAGFDN